MTYPKQARNTCRQRMVSQIEDRISALQFAQTQCNSANDEQAKRIGRQLTNLIRQRNDLRTADEIAHIERERGLSA